MYNYTQVGESSTTKSFSSWQSQLYEGLLSFILLTFDGNELYTREYFNFILRYSYILIFKHEYLLKI